MNKTNKHIVNVALIIGIVILICFDRQGWGWLLFLLTLNLL